MTCRSLKDDFDDMDPTDLYYSSTRTKLQTIEAVTWPTAVMKLLFPYKGLFVALLTATSPRLSYALTHRPKSTSNSPLSQSPWFLLAAGSILAAAFSACDGHGVLD